MTITLLVWWLVGRQEKCDQPGATAARFGGAEEMVLNLPQSVPSNPMKAGEAINQVINGSYSGQTVEAKKQTHTLDSKHE